MRPFYRKVFFGFVGLGIVGGAAGTYMQTRGQSSNSDGVEKVRELSGAEFNGLQDASRLKRALRGGHLPWSYHQRSERDPALNPASPAAATSPDDMKLVFYRLLGCPYCAKVEAVLRFYDVPYEEVQIDPISGGGLPDARYRLAPQLYFVPLQSPEATASVVSLAATPPEKRDGVFLVDSPHIVAGLAAPLGYGRDLKDPRITATRDWITARFQSVSFVATNSTVRNAYMAYGYITPQQYQNMLYRIVGSFALYGLANFKIKPRVLAQPHPFDGENRMIQAARAGDAQKPTKQSVEEWLRDELDIFLTRIRPDAPFHGGKQPDLADIEMFGVTRVVSDHPRLGTLVHSGRFGEWERAMKDVMAKNRNGRP